MELPELKLSHFELLPNIETPLLKTFGHFKDFKPDKPFTLLIYNATNVAQLVHRIINKLDDPKVLDIMEYPLKTCTNYHFVSIPGCVVGYRLLQDSKFITNYS